MESEAIRRTSAADLEKEISTDEKATGSRSVTKFKYSFPVKLFCGLFLLQLCSYTFFLFCSLVGLVKLTKSKRCNPVVVCASAMIAIILSIAKVL